MIKHQLKMNQNKSFVGIITNSAFSFSLFSFSNNLIEYLNDKCRDIDSLISIKQTKIDILLEYKKSLIYECVTGKKEVAL